MHAIAATKSLANLMEAVSLFHSEVDDSRLQTSTLLCFLYVALRGEVPQQELVDIMQVQSKTSVTRALQTLGKGQIVNGKREPGLEWLEQRDNESNLREKLVRLTPLGKKIALELQRAITKY